MNRETEFTYSEAPIDVTNQMEYDGTLTEQVQQEERSRLLGYFGRAAARVALVGAVLAGVLTGQGQDQDETAPVVEATPVLVASVSCAKGGVPGAPGTQVGELCVTREKPPQPRPCSKADRLIGAVSIGYVTSRLRFPAKVGEILGYGWTAKEIYTGDLCD
jgi:hypothetical protein